MSSYPREMRLIQIRDAVQRDLQVQRRQTRRRDLEELRRLDTEADSATDAGTKQTLGAKARALADKYLEDEEVLSSANGLLQKLNLPGSNRQGHRQDISAATLSFAGEPTIDVAPEAPPEPPTPQPPPPPVHPPPSSTASRSAARLLRLANPATPASSSSKVRLLCAQTAKERTAIEILAAAGSSGLGVLSRDLVVPLATQSGRAACAASRQPSNPPPGRTIAAARLCRLFSWRLTPPPAKCRSTTSRQSICKTHNGRWTKFPPAITR